MSLRLFAAFGIGLALAWPAGIAAQAVGPDRPVKVWVRLKDKGPAYPGLVGPAAGHSGPGSSIPGLSFRPGGTRAFEDGPLHEPYLATLAAAGFTCDIRLKWQNMVSGWVPAALVPRLRSLPFVASVSELPRKAPYAPFRSEAREPWRPAYLAKPAVPSGLADLPDLGVFGALADTLNILEVLRWMDWTGRKPGEGLRIAVMDADFDLGHAAFDRIRNEGRIKDQYDFVDKLPTTVTEEMRSSHGAQCLSLIGGYLPGKIVGGVPEADFLLYRTEDYRVESYVEEDYLAAAIERAVDSGAQVISISVVYRTEFDSTPDIPLEQMDGRTRPSSLAALGAARRNVLVVTAMGNLDGNQSGPSTLSAPSDADSIIAVGIVNKAGGLCGYSTTGPTADGRVKPEVVSMGVVGSCSVELAGTHTREGLSAAQGTSFAAPAVAALVALLRQAQPDKPSQQIRQDLLATARNAANPNSQIGWGLPDAQAAMAKGHPDVSVRKLAPLARVPAGAVLHDAAGRRLPTGAGSGAPGIRFYRAPLLP